MKNLCALIFAGGLLLPCVSRAADVKQAKFTQVVNNVEVISSDQARHPAAVNGLFKMPDVLRTGPASRAELLADDNTLTRVGANTVFSFDPANRTLDLQQGSLLFHSPHGKGGGTIHTGSATASVLGTTIIVTTTPNGGFKVLTLEGQAEVRFLNGQHLTLTPGQMTFILPGGGISPIVVFRLDKETAGSLLVNGFTDPLPSWPKISDEITRQLLLLLNNRLQDVGLVVGNNATPETVQVRMDILNNGQSSPFDTDAAIIGPDHTPSQTLPVNYNPPSQPLDPNHLETGPFAYPGLQSFMDGLLFLGIVNPASGFAGNNIDIDTANIDLTAFAAMPDFDVMASGDMRIWQSVNFTPSFYSGSGSEGDGGIILTPASLVSTEPDTISLLAGGQMLIAPNSTLEADTKLFGLVAGSFGVLDTTTGLADGDFPNTLLNVSLINLVGDVDLLSLSDLTIQGMNSGNTIYASGNVEVDSEGSLTLGTPFTPESVRPLGVGHNTAVSGYLSANLTAQNDLTLFDTVVFSGGGDIGLNSIAGNINVNALSYLNASGMVSLNAASGVNVGDSTLQALNGNVDINGGGDVGISYSTIGAGGDVTIQAGGALNLGAAPISYDVSISANGAATLSAGGNATVVDTHIVAGGNVDITSGNTTVPGGLILPVTGGNLDLENSLIYAGDNGSLGQGSSMGGSLDIDAVNGSVNLNGDDLYAYYATTPSGLAKISSPTTGNVTINADGYVDVQNSSISQDGLVFATAGDYVKLHDVFNDLFDGASSDTYLTGWNITAGSYVSVGADADVQIYNSSIIANGGDVDITSQAATPLTTKNTTSASGITIGNSLLQASGSVNVTAANGDVNVLDSQIFGNGNDVYVSADAGMLTVNAGRNFSVASLVPGGGADIYANETLTLNGGSGVSLVDTALSAGKAIDITTGGGDALLEDLDVTTESGDVSVSANGGNLTLNSGAAEHGVSIGAGGAVSLGADGNVSVSDANLTAADGGVSIKTSDSLSPPTVGAKSAPVPAITSGAVISIAGSSLTANSGDVDIQNGTSLTPPPGLPSQANNLNITGGSTITANSGDVNLTTDQGVNLAGSTVSANGSGGTTGNVTVNAGAGITVNGASLTGDAAAGTVALNSASRATAIVNGASAQAFYLNVNSPDGILIDGRSGGVNLKGNTMNLTASATDPTKGITIKSADLTAYATVNMAAHTVSLTDVAFGAKSYDNFQTFYGALAANPNTGASVQSGYLNFINGVTYGGTLITSGNQSTYVNPASGPGVYVSPLH